MHLLHFIQSLLGNGQQPHGAAARPAQHQQQLSVGQAQHQQLGNNTALAHAYAQNPQSFAGSGIDPAQFGYPADIGGQQLHVNQPTNFGIPTRDLTQPNVGFGYEDAPQYGVQDPMYGLGNERQMIPSFVQGPGGQTPQYGASGAAFRTQGGDNAYHNGLVQPFSPQQRLHVIQQAYRSLR